MKKRGFTHKTLSGQKGFTLVEILVVLIVLGVLAGIAIPALLSQRERARDAAAKSDLRKRPRHLRSWDVAGGFWAKIEECRASGSSAK